jgi:hypothetical protein
MKSITEKRLTIIAVVFLATLLPGRSFSQDDELSVDHDGSSSSVGYSATTPAKTSSDAGDNDENIIKKPKEPEAPPPREFTKAEIQKVCAKYQGKLISVYGEIYKLQKCQRHLIQDQEELFKFSKQGLTVVEVEATDVAALPIGDHWESVSVKDRPCGFFNRKYVTFSYTDIYYVENCERRLIPDYETLLQHRRDRGQRNGEVLALNAREFYAIRHGRDLASIIDKELHRLLDGSAGVDVIPIDEACKGIDGKIVTFYSRMYKIERCRKREVDAESFTMRRKINDSKIIELRAEQWLSIPDGKPWVEKK